MTDKKHSMLFQIVKLFKYLIMILLGAVIILILILSIRGSNNSVNTNILLGEFYDKTNILNSQKQRNLAKSYFKKVLLQGSVAGECYLGELYAKELNYKLAGAYYLDSALKGSERCEVNFIKLSYPNEKSVFDILKIKADKNNPSAQFMVGKRLIEGNGRPVDVVRGINYLEDAVSQNHRGAKIYLAGLYIQGALVPQDIKKANLLMEFNKNYKKDSK